MKKKFLFISLALFGLLILGIFFDQEIARGVAAERVSSINDFMIWVSYGGTWFFVLVGMTSLFLWNEKKRNWILPLWLSLGISMALTYALKYLIARERPFELLHLQPLAAEEGRSFPSGHATAVFSTLGVLDKEFPKFKWFWLGFALLVAFSRMYLGVHYLSDVVAGGIIGFSVGLFVVHYWEKKIKR